VLTSASDALFFCEKQWNKGDTRLAHVSRHSVSGIKTSVCMCACMHGHGQACTSRNRLGTTAQEIWKRESLTGERARNQRRERKGRIHQGGGQVAYGIRQEDRRAGVGVGKILSLQLLPLPSTSPSRLIRRRRDFLGTASTSARKEGGRKQGNYQGFTHC
jgi:hypothetical protein